MSSDPQADYQYKLQAHASYVAERKEADAFALELGGRYEKLQSLIAGGALAVSVTFLEKIAPAPSADSRWFALVGWGALGVSLLASLFAVAEGQNALQWKIKSLDAEIGRRLYPEAFTEEVSQPVNPYSARVARANIVSRVCTALGLICLIAFAFLNIPLPSHEQNASSLATTTSTAAIAGPNPSDERLIRADNQSSATPAAADEERQLIMETPQKPSDPAPSIPSEPMQESRGSYLPSKNQVPIPPPPPPKEK